MTNNLRVTAVNRARRWKEKSLERHLDIIDTLFACIKLRDEPTAVHSVIMAHYSFELAQIHAREEALLYYAGSLTHDVGKIAMNDTILKSGRKLSTEERQQLWEHVSCGTTLLKELDLPRTVIEIAQFHHERFDGSGYVSGLKGYGIPLTGRITAVSDTYSALVSNRPYQNARQALEALEIMKRDSHLFDPNILESFIEIVEREQQSVRSEKSKKMPWNKLMGVREVTVDGQL